MNVNKIVFVDESGLNRKYRRLYARAKRGVKVHEKTNGKRQKYTNIIAGLVYGKTAERYIVVQNYEHSTTAVFFEGWFEFELIPLLPESALVIMDNAAFHPIEHSWANFKQWLRYSFWHFPYFDFAIDYYFNL